MLYQCNFETLFNNFSNLIFNCCIKCGHFSYLHRAEFHTEGHGSAHTHLLTVLAHNGKKKFLQLDPGT